MSAARRLTLIATAIALLAGAALVLIPRPAQAQSAIWSATLTVVTHSDGITTGCYDPATCSSGLSSDTFTYKGRTYTVTAVQALIGLSVGFGTDANPMPDDLKALTLRLDNQDFPLGSADLEAVGSVVWNTSQSRPTPTWTVNQIVQVSLLPPPPDDWQSWRPTLTVQDLGSGSFGCTFGQTADKECATVMTDNTFVFGGLTYTVNVLYVGSSNELQFQFATRPIPDALKAYTLRVGNTNLPIGDAQVASSLIFWENTGLTLAAGDRVTLRLLPTRDDWQSWRPTLTVQRAANNFGCSNAWSDPAKHCSAALTDDDFIFGAKTYTVEYMAHDQHSSLGFNSATHSLPDELKKYTLRLGDGYFPFGNADIYTGTNAVWLNTGVTWTEGQRLQVRLLQGLPPNAPTDLALEPGGSGRITATWVAPQAETDKVPVTGYELQYRWEDAPNEAATGADPAFGWLSQRVGSTTQATISGLTNGLVYHVRVRALSASGPSPWSSIAVGAPGERPATRATPLQVLSVSHTSITEGQVTSGAAGTVTVTVRLARPAAEDRTIKLKPYGTARKIFDYNWLDITIAAGERTGTGQIWISNDAEVEGAEIIILRVESLPPEAYPSPGAAVYQLIDARITILDNDTPAPSDPGDTNTYHTDRAQPDDVAKRGGPAIAEIAKRQAACAASTKAEVDAWLKGTGTKAAVDAAQRASPACQF